MPKLPVLLNEFGVEGYAADARLDGSLASAIAISLVSATNKLDTAIAIKTRGEALAKFIPEGVDHAYPYDATPCVTIAFSGGSTGVIQQQLANTIVSAMVLSVIVELTLTPALCATLPRPHDSEPKNGFIRRFAPRFDRGFDRGFNRDFGKLQTRYTDSVGWLIRRPRPATSCDRPTASRCHLKAGADRLNHKGHSKLMRLFCLLLFLVVWPSAHPAPIDDVLNGFPPPRQDFERHIDEVRNYLLDTQLDGRSAEDVEYNVPFELRASDKVSYRGKYLLVHGLNDSPAVWHDTGRALAARGFDVRAILLPGHGNTPEAQLHVSWHQWLDAARLQLDYWRSTDAPIYLGGFSLGGVIATLLALENEEKDEYEGIDGLFLYAPAYYSTKVNLLRWASLVSPFQPWVFGGMIIEDNPTKYNSIPINGAAQYYKAARHLQRKWKRRTLTMPVLIVESVDDSVVDSDITRRILANRFSSPQRRLLLYANDATKPSRHEVVRPSRYPEFRILNQSHQGMMVSPENTLFGVHGTQLVCNGNKWSVFSACLYYAKGPHWHGAEGTASPDGVPVARTTFNPDFEGVMALHDEVFEVDARPQENR